MLAAYLSQGWFDDANEVARGDGRLRAATAGARVTIQQVVTGGPDGDVPYWVRVDDGSVETGPGRAAAPDATVSQSYATAAALSRGELSVEDALLAGRARITGDVAALVRHQTALLHVATALDHVRARTTYA